MFAVAVDCMALRSISIRPRVLIGAADVVLLGTLPMLNLLALLITSLLWRRVRARSFWIGFVAGGVLALPPTILGMNRSLSHLESVLGSIALGDWLASSQVAAMALGFIVIPGFLLLSQLLAASAGGSLAQWIAAGRGLAPTVAPRHRLQLGAYLCLGTLLAAPAVVTEVALQRTVDPMTARKSAGTIAVVEATVVDGWRVAFPDGSTRLLPNGTMVRIDDDSQPSRFAGVRSARGEQFGDHRPVIVTLLDGDRSGEATSVPRQFLQDRR
jgi:hypothetical protein